MSWRRGWLLLLPPTFSRGGACPLPSFSRKIRFLTRHRRPSLAKHSPAHHTRAIGMVRAPFLPSTITAHFPIRGSPMRVFTDLSVRFTSRSSLMMGKLPGEGHTSVLKARINSSKTYPCTFLKRVSSRLPQFKDDKAMHSACRLF